MVSSPTGLSMMALTTSKPYGVPVERKFVVNLLQIYDCFMQSTATPDGLRPTSSEIDDFVNFYKIYFEAKESRKGLGVLK